MIEKYGVDLEFGRHPGHFVTCYPVMDAQPAAPGLQGVLQIRHAGMNEGHPTVGRIGPCIEYVSVKHKHSKYLPGPLERVIKRSMVIIPQVAVKPD